MSEADCPICEYLGYRTCDRCGGIIFEPEDGHDEDLCPDCDTRD